VNRARRSHHPVDQSAPQTVMTSAGTFLVAKEGLGCLVLVVCPSSVGRLVLDQVLDGLPACNGEVVAFGGSAGAESPRRLLDYARSNPPLFVSDKNVLNSTLVKTRTGPPASLVSRMPIRPCGKSAISTQLPA
jgi:hypothetical protein